MSSSEEHAPLRRDVQQPPGTPDLPSATGMPAASTGLPAEPLGTPGQTTGAPSGGQGNASSTAETAEQEAAGVAHTAADQAGNVAETAKDEVKTVAQEAKSQVKDLYAQTQSELRDQAAAQQQRVADGLQSVGDQLRSMADGADQPGLAADLVRQASTRASDVASWLGNRGPDGLLSEVKSYARRSPGTFIALAALAGLAAGRLTRALAEGASSGAEEEARTQP